MQIYKFIYLTNSLITYNYNIYSRLKYFNFFCVKKTQIHKKAFVYNKRASNNSVELLQVLVPVVKRRVHIYNLLKLLHSFCHVFWPLKFSEAEFVYFIRRF